ncbi:Uncharacterized conserved protein [Phaffia rhodozyma]|uniref:Splicing factor YJU2 n=1 Tax=Phaffia rhodozyma TaxID=264483 RepID=A0A0F7SKC9_PHARH|nr:Uncharacterized conserved protein [Phaffia rhodozyma]
MSERKVLNKYFPPDFDPAKIPRRKLKDKNDQQVVRLMAPFSMRCNSCGEYIYKGKKFNARKETVLGEDYHGIKIFRFYIKCTLCSSEITFKTDPQNADYLAEHGASRNFESWRDDADEHNKATYMPDAGEDDEEESAADKEREDAMKMLESSTESAKREMDILDALQDIRSRNARNERVGISLSEPHPSTSKGALTAEDLVRLAEEEEDEKLVRSVFAQIPSSSTKPVALGGEYGSSDEDVPEKADGEESKPIQSTITVKRKYDPSMTEDDSPSLASLLEKKGLAGRPGPSAVEAGVARKGTGVGGGFGFGAGVGGVAKKKKIGGLLGGIVVKKK